MKRSIAVLTAIALTVLSGCRGGSSALDEIKLPIYGADEIRFEIAEAQYMDISETRSIGAVIGYPYTVYVNYPGEPGTQTLLTSWNIIKGREVQQGEILAELDSSALDYEINNQQTQVNAAYAASLSGGQTARLQYEIEQYSLDMRLAERDSYTLKAPFDGIITYTNRVNEGSYAAGGTVCFGISETDRAWVYVEGNDASLFRFGQQVQVKINDTMYDAEVVQAPDCAPADATGSAAQRAVFDLGEGVLESIRERDPMSITAGWATVYLTTEKKNVLAVPDEAVKQRGTVNYVTIVDGEERYRLYVTAGVRLGGYTEILDGISEGDIVMAEGSGVFSSADNDTGGQDWAPPEGDWGGWQG